MNAAEEQVRIVGRYAIHGELASGGMGTVSLGRLLGDAGFARTVAIKTLHAHYARDPEFVAMFLDEARLVSRIRHPNVVPTLDVVALDGELLLVMDYVAGEPLSRVMMELARRKERMPVKIAVAIGLGLLEGLHAAHEAKSEEGTWLRIVHRDVSPQNVIVGADGVPRVLDFGIAKAAERLQTTEDGSFKGKLGYLPPDVLSGAPADRRADIWGAAVVLWEMLVGKRLFVSSDSPAALVKTIVEGEVDAPSRRGAASPPALDAVLERALMKSPDARFATAREMALALEAAVEPASSRAIAEWLRSILGTTLDERAARVGLVERSSRSHRPSAGAVRSLAAGATPSARPRTDLLAQGAPAIAEAGPAGAAPGEAPGPTSRRSGRRGRVAIVVGAVAALAMLLLYTLDSIARRSDSAAAVTPATTMPIDARPESGAIDAEVVSTSAEASAPVVAAPGGGSPSSSAVARPAAPARGARGSPVSCVPPYTIGPPPDYIRKPKLECLPRR
jgi:eukaryotic-like serine/threonine-protein kinase